MEKLLIFEVVKPQGIKGELKIKLYADSFDSVSRIKTVYAENGGDFSVLSIKDAGGSYGFIKLKEVGDRNMAETMRGFKFYAEKSKILKEKDRYFISDLIGFTVIAGKKVGALKDVISSNVDMFLIEGENVRVYMPFLKKLNPIIDFDNKTITVDEELFKELSYYEN